MTALMAGVHTTVSGTLQAVTHNHQRHCLKVVPQLTPLRALTLVAAHWVHMRQANQQTLHMRCRSLKSIERFVRARHLEDHGEVHARPGFTTARVSR
jgi:hypothetical protein